MGDNGRSRVLIRSLLSFSRSKKPHYMSPLTNSIQEIAAGNRDTFHTYSWFFAHTNSRNIARTYRSRSAPFRSPRNAGAGG